MKKTRRWKKYTFEFLSIFIAVISAFALNNWNDNKRDRASEVNILREIANGLKRDIKDIQLNIGGHEFGVKACNFWRKVVNDETVYTDSTELYYYRLTRDFVSIQNTSGYESLKSKGLEIIGDDSLRYNIISLYEYHFNVLRKLEEEYAEMQFHQSYFKEFNDIIAPHLRFSGSRITGLNQPLLLGNRKNVVLSYLWKIERNRQFILDYYQDVEEKARRVISEIEEEIK